MDAARILVVLALMGMTEAGQYASAAPSAAATRHTTYFAGQDGWSSGTENPPPAAAPTNSRYQYPPAGSSSAISPPPSVVDRTRMAVTESSNALRDGVEAGIQAANRQLYEGGGQMVDATRTAGQEFGQQFQGWAGTTSTQNQSGVSNTAGTLPPIPSNRQGVSNPFATTPPATNSNTTTTKTRGGLAPPPWVANPSTSASDFTDDDFRDTVAPTRTAALGTVATQSGGWSSINSGVTPPSLVVPRLVNSPDNASRSNVRPADVTPVGSAPLQPLVGERGPGFPATSSSRPPADRSLVTNNQQPPAPPANDDWELGWDGASAAQPAVIGGRYGANDASSRQDLSRPDATPRRDFGAAPQPNSPLVARIEAQPPSQPKSTPGFDAWANEDPWDNQPSNTQNGVGSRPNTAPPAIGSTAANPMSQQGATPVSHTGSAHTAAAPDPAVSTTGAAAAPAPAPATQAAQPGEQKPWVPLLVVSLSLAGSIGANLFLGWSYMDARQKYRNLIQKTANKFRRAATA